MNDNRISFLGIVLVLGAGLGCLAQNASAVERASINGTVKFLDTPVCAMVLANGQSMFSCSGDGSYALDVPLDDQGQITLFAFASNFAPYKQVLTPDQAVDHRIEMQRDNGSKRLTVDHYSDDYPPGQRVDLSGTVDSEDTPVCAFVLANGQDQFSCGDSLGSFQLDVPKDTEGRITLYVFASNFAPYKQVIDPSLHPLNDTGTDRCANAASNDVDCPVSDFPGQDAEYGRDATEDDDSDGEAGFSFTKLDANGDPLPVTAAQWSCVYDNVTGLTWEVKRDDGGLQDRDHGYTWYNTDDRRNGGTAGYQGNQDVATCVMLQDCNTQAYVEAINAMKLCGHDDWRMPEKKEFRNLLLFPKTGYRIDRNFFPESREASFWSATPHAEYSDWAWLVNFWDARSFGFPKSGISPVRLVRGGQ